MICFLPPLPAAKPEPEPVPHRDARAPEAIILVFVILNVIVMLTSCLPLLARRHGGSAAAHASVACGAGPTTAACRGEGASAVGSAAPPAHLNAKASAAPL